MSKECMLTTIDNPFDPFEQFTSWLMFDIEKGYNSCSYLARIVNLSDDMTQKEMDEGLKILKPHYDLILSHTCAIEDEPTHLFLSGVDQTFVNKKMEHYISKVKKQITYDVHLWGHYHKTEFHEGKPLKVMLYNDQAVELEILFKERWF